MKKQIPLLDLKDTSKNKEDEELCALDELFKASKKYRSSKEYSELLQFISKFRRYAPFNCLLLHIQNPDLTYVASIRDWEKKFNRQPKRNARPLVILQPFGPVMFLYDLLETEGDPVPDSVLKPFDTEGCLHLRIFENTIRNCKLHGIEVRDDIEGLYSAGKAIKLNVTGKQKYKDLNLSTTSECLILLNKNHSIEEKYSTLAHELGHIFCGHLGVSFFAWWDSNVGTSENAVEIEAESVAYLVCRRHGLKSSSERYLSKYRTPENISMPFFSLNSVLQAVDYIEKMGKKRI